MAPVDAIAALVGEWKENDKFVKQASTGVMAVVGKRSELTRKEVSANYEILIPVIKHLGPLLDLRLQYFIFLGCLGQ